MSDPTADRVIKAYVALRDKRSELKREYEAADAILKDKMNKLEVWLLTKMKEVGTTQLKGDDAVAFISTKDRVTCSDWGEYWAFLSKNDRLDMLEKRVSGKTVMEYYEETGELPPGLSVSREQTVNVRKA